MISFHDIEGAIDTALHGSSQVWSIVDDSGTPIISFKTLLKAEYRSSGSVVFEPIEQNSFATYNKTSEPMEYFFEVALQGASTLPGFTNNNFAAALTRLEELKVGTETFSFITPFKAFYNLTLEGYSTVFEHTTSMIVIGLQCKEVKEVQQGYTNVELKNDTASDVKPISQSDASNPDNVDTSDTGITNTTTPTSEEKKETMESILYPLNPEDDSVGGSGGGFEDE